MKHFSKARFSKVPLNKAPRNNVHALAKQLGDLR